MADIRNGRNSFETIRLRLVAKLRNWLPTFEALEAALRDGRGPAGDLEDIRMQMHKLAGSARTFGFADLTVRAAEVEACLDRIVEAPASDHDVKGALADLRRRLGAFLEEARGVINLHLPASDAQHPDAVAEALPETAFDYTILLADDDELVRDLVKHGLQGKKCNITEAENGAGVIALLEQAKQSNGLGTPDLILLDVNMPGINGFGVLERLKSDPELMNIPVIMLTRRDEDSNILNGISAGVRDYITKPFEVSDLVARIMDTLRRYKTKVLVADDDELICELLRHRFHRMGYSVLIAKNGTEALTRIRAERPDISILDVMMPGTEGTAVLNQLKENPETADLPVIMLSAKNQQDNIIKGLESGAHDYITKPFDLDELSARVSGILHRRKAV